MLTVIADPAYTTSILTMALVGLNGNLLITTTR
ncbi:hypothetical protein M0802_016567 [Mischocyttarus mexicanus]|nr:hypothetical protein M0802_016567 [Mischocyttarus mexicanus]